MVRIIEAENVITCPECNANLSYGEADVFFNKLVSCEHKSYYNKCVMCPCCKNKIFVADGAVFVEPTDVNGVPIDTDGILIYTDDVLITDIRRKE